MPLTTLHITRNRYRIEALATRSHDGATYRAYDLQRGVPVFLDERVPRPGTDAGTIARRRTAFQERAAALATIDHPHLAGIIEAFDEGGADYLVSSVVEGEGLADLIARAGAVPEGRVLLWAHQLLGALAAMHERGIPHGTVNPQAIMITPAGDAILGGFGQSLAQSTGTRRATAFQEAIARDLHDLGATLAAALEGRPRAHTQLRWVWRARSVSQSRSQPAMTLNAVIARALAGSTDKRWPDALTMAAALPSVMPDAPESDGSPTAAPQSADPSQSAGQGQSAGPWPLPDRPASFFSRPWLRWLWVPAAVVLLLAAGLIWANATRDPEPVPLVAVTPTTLASVPVISSTVRPRDGMTMVYVPAGTFAMGSFYGNLDNRPIHDVTLDAFWLDQTQVTTAQYSWCVVDGACAALEPYEDPALSNADHPVVGLTWFEALNYCTWVGARLPTEAEWEYAARGPEERMYPWGSSSPQGLAVCMEEYCADGFESSAPVASFPKGASWVGAVDLAGNVWEWVSDWYEQGYYFASPKDNPTGPEEGATRSLRGGGWGFNAANIRSTRRGSAFPGARSGYLGFRCASDTPPVGEPFTAFP